MVVYDRDALIALIQRDALQYGEFVLASGKRASYYLDCRKVTLNGDGARWIGAGILQLLGDQLPDAVGGMAIGADPVTAAVITVASVNGRALRGFIVRKETKGHGTGRVVEGPVKPGDRVIMVEDVVTTGGSALQAIEHAEAFGLRIEGVIGVVDRLEGGAEAFARRGITLRTLLTVRDLGVPIV